MQVINEYFKIGDSDKIKIYFRNTRHLMILIDNKDDYANYIRDVTPLAIQIIRDVIHDENPSSPPPPLSLSDLQESESGYNSRDVIHDENPSSPPLSLSDLQESESGYNSRDSYSVYTTDDQDGRGYKKNSIPKLSSNRKGLIVKKSPNKKSLIVKKSPVKKSPTKKGSIVKKRPTKKSPVKKRHEK
jgi:hypothetical protein